MVFFVPLGLGTYLTLQEKFTSGGMLTSVQLMNYIVSPIRNYLIILNKLKGIKPVNEKIEKIIDENSHVNTGVIKNSFNKSIELKNLSFFYNEERQILKNIDLNINKGEKIAYDRILVLEDGEVIEDGSFNELMDKKEFFYSLYSIEKVAT